jgi:periplasmic divalent cation tolerance protein
MVDYTVPAAEDAMDTVLIYSTWPDEAQAKACAAALVEARAAACATVLPGATSTYRWEGAIETAAEAVLLAKTGVASAAAARDLILARHPYELPCILTLRCDTELSHAPYLAWTRGETA